MNYLTEMQDVHARLVEPYTGKPKGCSRSEIDSLEKIVGRPLPAAYRQWLAWMGKDYSGVLVGTDCFYNSMPIESSILEDLYGWDHEAFPIPRDPYVFFSHQGYIVAWFSVSDVQLDPRVFCFSEGRDMVTPIEGGSFTDFMTAEIRGMAQFLPSRAITRERRDWWSRIFGRRFQ